MHKSQRGMAMIVVLFILALMVVIAVNINEYWQQSLFRTQQLQFQQQSKWTLYGAESLLQKQLMQSNGVVTEGQIRQELSFDDETIQVQVRDLNTCFNLNALLPPKRGAKNDSENIILAEDENRQPVVEQQEKEQSDEKDEQGSNKEPAGNPAEPPLLPYQYAAQVFTHLLQRLDVGEVQAEQISKAVREKLGVSEESLNEQASAKLYYPFSDISELRGIEDIDVSLYRQLKPLICALPERELKININHLQVGNSYHALLFSALFNGSISEQQVSRVLHTRPEKGWKGAEEMLQQPEFKNSSSNSALSALGTESHYFDVLFWVEQDENYYSLRTMMKYEGQTWQVLQRKFGVSD